MAAISNQESESFGQVYNVGTGINHSINEIASMISDNTINIPERIGESRITLADNSKLRNTFGWEPQVELKDWINLQDEEFCVFGGTD